MSAAVQATGFGVAAPIRRDAAAWVAATVGVAVLCLVFRREIAAAVSVWDSSTAYGHCWLVLPIAAWLAWERRAVLADTPARPLPWAGLLALPLATIWLVAELLGVMEGRQLAALGFGLVLLLAALGIRLWWGFSVAFLYLIFLVPFGAFVTPALQHFTAGFIVAGLHVLDIPCEADTFRITIPEGVFYVAEACAGLRFLIASIAFGVLYAVTMFRSPWRRAAFMAVACVVPVVANGVRGLGIVLLGHVLGSAQAGAADHLIYGWVFFSTVILLLAASGLPFREPAAATSQPRAPGIAANSAARPAGVILACLPVLLVAIAGPLSSFRTDAGPALAWPLSFALPQDCRAAPASAASGTASTTFACGDQVIRVFAVALPRGSNPARVLDAARGPALLDLGGDIDSALWTAPDGAPWMVSHARETGHVSAFAIRVDGVQGVGNVRDRLRLLSDMLGRGGPLPPEALALTAIPGGTEGEAELKSVLVHLEMGSGAKAPVGF